MPFTGNFTCNVFKVGILDGVYDLSSTTTQVFKIALYTNQANLNETTTSYTTVGEVSGTGYVAGGNTLTLTVNPTVGATDNVVYLSFQNSSWAGASFTARGALIYKFDGATNPAICVLDFGSDKTVSNGNFTVQFPPPTSTSAIIRIN